MNMCCNTKMQLYLFYKTKRNAIIIQRKKKFYIISCVKVFRCWKGVLAGGISLRQSCGNQVPPTAYVIPMFLQSQAVDPETFSGQDSSMLLEQKAQVFSQQYTAQAQMAQGSYAPMQDPSFHAMGQRPGYAALRMQPRPGLRPASIIQSQPNQLRLQLQHRLQAQQVWHEARCVGPLRVPCLYA